LADLQDLKNDLHLYDPASVTWFNLSSHARGSPPCERTEHGFAWVGGKLYVHGGRGKEGNTNILALASQGIEKCDYPGFGFARNRKERHGNLEK
jgi:hypothetical protein